MLQPYFLAYIFILIYCASRSSLFTDPYLPHHTGFFCNTFYWAKLVIRRNVIYQIHWNSKHLAKLCTAFIWKNKHLKASMRIISLSRGLEFGLIIWTLVSFLGWRKVQLLIVHMTILSGKQLNEACVCSLVKTNPRYSWVNHVCMCKSGDTKRCE